VTSRSGRTRRRAPASAAAWAPAWIAAITLTASACSFIGSSPAGTAARSPGTAARLGPKAGPGRHGLVLQVSPAPYQLPAAVSRATVLPAGSGLLILGGLTPRSVSTDAVTRLDPATGATRPAGTLASATHDAAGAVLGGRPYLFGGGSAASVATVQAVSTGGVAAVTGRLPTVRSDVSGVTVGPTAYLVGGYDGTTYDAAVLATSDGRHFRTAARLPIPVRYPAVAADGSQIWVFGGQTPSGPTSAVQRINVRAGTASVAGHLPQPVQGASAVTLDGRIYVAGGQLTASAGADTAAPGSSGDRPAVSRTVLGFDPGTGHATAVAQLPVPVAYAGAAVAGGGTGGTGGTAYLVGGSNGQRNVPAVTVLRLVPGGSAAEPGTTPWLSPASDPGHLIPGSDPSVLPTDVLIADHQNNRLLIVDPQGRIRWEFPRPGELARGQTFLEPDDAFFSPDGRYIIATQEDDFVISVIDVATGRIVYRYGVAGHPGAGPNHLFNPDDAMLTPAGKIVTADIKNCRIVLITPPAHKAQRVIGETSNVCLHVPPHRFGSPNGAFPMTDGNYLITEINGDWADEMSLRGHVAWSANPPGVIYPSDTNEVYPGRYLTVDYSDPGQVVEFDASGRLLWRHGGLNKPSLALPLPNGDILVNDDFNHRVIVVDPVTNRIVWQYGHTGIAGRAPGYLRDPDGVDLAPPDSLLVTHAGTMGEP
jgi:hypothetical protein